MGEICGLGRKGKTFTEENEANQDREFLRSLGYLLFNSLPARKRSCFSGRNQTPATPFR